MLKLRKVEIVGFKSFCERTIVTFSGSGTTCIVGPNGCGKSNVVDAISWVLGEQSHKSLRAERMADCIFNGTVKRPPMGLAEVTITMEDPELAEAARFVLETADIQSQALQRPSKMAKLLSPSSNADGHDAALAADDPNYNTEIHSLVPAQSPEQSESTPDDKIETPTMPPMAEDRFKRRKKSADKPMLATRPGEVVISRRLYRSGQSEYLINGRTGRLRDIQEMFMGVGLGPDSYAIIEQGRIGLILSTKPMERRAIIEEAAGVTKFKTKKRLAEAKLESSNLNLSRVNDIVVEVEKQLGSLKRQASKARRYSEIRDQMRGIVRQMLAGKTRELDHEADRLAAQLSEMTAAETQHATDIQQQEDDHDRLNQRIYALDAEIRQNQNVLNLTALEVDRGENKINFNRQRSEELSLRHTQVSTELSQAAAQAAECERRSDAQIQAVTQLREESGTLTGRVENLAGSAHSRAALITESEERIEALRRSELEAGESLLRLHGEQKQAEEALVHQGQALYKLESNEHELLESSIKVRDDADTAAHEFEAASGQLSILKQKAADWQATIQELRQEQETIKQQVDALRDSSVRRACSPFHSHANSERPLLHRRCSAEAFRRQ